MGSALSKRRALRKAGRVWNRRGKGLPLLLSHHAGRNSRGGNSFTLITLPGLPIAFPGTQWLLHSSVTHRNMARTSHSVRLTQDAHILNIQTRTANQKAKVAGWSATVFPLQHSVHQPLKTVMTLRTKTTHVLPSLHSGWRRRPDASAALPGM